MNKLVIILICALFLFSCASTPSEVPNQGTPTIDSEDSKDPVLWYVEKVKESPMDEILDWLEAFDMLPNPLK